MNVPYCIVKSKSRLGTLVHHKTATAVALTDVRPEHKQDLAALIQTITANYNDKFEEARKTWGGGIMSNKSQAKTLKQLALQTKEAEIRA